MSRHIGRAAAALAAVVIVALTGSVADARGIEPAGAVAEAVQEPGAVHFTAAGDYGSTDQTRDVLDLIKELDPDLHLALGDLSYGRRGAESSWCDLVTQHVGRTLPFELLAGNHESDGRNGNIDAFAKCLPNRLPGLVGTYGRDWYVDVPRDAPVVRFVVVSGGLTYPDGRYDYKAGSPRYRWTEAAIDGAREAAVPWVVVGMHKPCISMGEYPCDPGTDVHDLLVRKKVDLVLHGHEHLYQRTHQLALGRSCPSIVPNSVDRDCIADRDTDLEQGAGTVFATVGTGGRDLRAVDTGDREAGYFATASGKRTPTWGVLDVRATRTTLTADFAATDGGKFRDRFTITAGDDAAPGPQRPPVEPSPTSPPVPPTSRLAADTFGRTTRAGLGTAELGGPWRAGAGRADYAVGGGAGRVTLAGPGAEGDLALPGVSSSSTDLVHSFAVDGKVTGNGLYAGVSARRVRGVGEYRANVRLEPGGDVVLSLARVVDGEQTLRTKPRTLPGVTHADGRKLLVRTQVTGTAPTAVRARVWQAGTREPTVWHMSATDSTRALQARGSIGIEYQLSRSGRNAPLGVLIDDVVARQP